MDKKYQRAYVAIYTAFYKKNWQNGIGMHAGHLATRYYLIRVPDQSFIKQKQAKEKLDQLILIQFIFLVFFFNLTEHPAFDKGQDKAGG